MKLELFLNRKSFLLLLTVLCCASIGVAQESKLLDILDEELNREFKILSQVENPVYYMDYQVRDVKNLFMSTNLGSLNKSNPGHNRIAKVNVRIGDYTLDNTHQTTQGRFDSGYEMGNVFPIVLEDNKQAITQTLWTLTNLEYQKAEKRFKNLSNGKIKDKSSSFTKETPVVYEDTLKVVDFIKDQRQIENQLKRLSSLFLENEDIVTGEVSLSRNLETKYFVSTEKSKIAHQNEYNFLSVNALIRDSKGELIPLYQTYFAFAFEDLPNEEKLKEDIIKLIATLVELQSAPLAEPYTGPALLHPRAAGVFFHEIFGHRIEGSRLKSDFDSQTFKEKIGKEVLPKSFNVYMDPSLTSLDTQDLLGHYLFDDEGVRGQRVNVVEKGILKNFLMTRKPLDVFINSNGHARTQGRSDPVSRQSNLLVESTKNLSTTELRKQLIKECKKQKKEYGYYFKDVQGGFTTTDRFSPNAFNIMPTLVYRIYVDGRPDELVRGVDLIGTPLSMFAEIKATGDERGTFNGYCGAESGNVPVSATAPGLLVRRIETQKKFRVTNDEEGSILPRPVSND